MVSSRDYALVCRIVGSGNVLISYTVDRLATEMRISHKRARYIVRATLDKRLIITDSNFRLHVNNA